MSSRRITRAARPFASSAITAGELSRRLALLGSNVPDAADSLAALRARLFETTKTDIGSATVDATSGELILRERIASIAAPGVRIQILSTPRGKSVFWDMFRKNTIIPGSTYRQVLEGVWIDEFATIPKGWFSFRRTKHWRGKKFNFKG